MACTESPAQSPTGLPLDDHDGAPPTPSLGVALEEVFVLLAGVVLRRRSVGASGPVHAFAVLDEILDRDDTQARGLIGPTLEEEQAGREESGWPCSLDC